MGSLVNSKIKDRGASPDSTTLLHKSVSVGDEVLSHGKDGLFYLGHILQVEIEEQRALVEFGDSSQHWSLFKDITKLSSSPSCVICSSSDCEEDNNQIIECSACSLPYHQICHQPSVRVITGSWLCNTCNSNKGDNSVKTNFETFSSSESAKQEEEDKMRDCRKRLPYDLSSLNWDVAHRTNDEETYCYCGGPGEWYGKMLHCQRCKQWFHEACVECLDYPLFHGDR